MLILDAYVYLHGILSKIERLTGKKFKLPEKRFFTPDSIVSTLRFLDGVLDKAVEIRMGDDDGPDNK